MLCMASCCSGITVICTATRFQAASLLAPRFTGAVSTPCYLPQFGCCVSLSCRSWSGCGAGRVLAQVSVTQLELTQCEWVWLIVRHLASWRHPQMLSQPLHHVAEPSLHQELMQSLHCLSYVEVSCPREREKSNQTSLSVQLCCTTVNLNLGNSHLQ